MTKTVLVTGAAGFIGSAVATALGATGHRVIAVDALLGGLYPKDEKVQRFEKLGSVPGVETHLMDLRTDDLSTLPTDITHVINEAAMPGLGLSWQNFDLYAGCNLTATARLIEASTGWPLERFVQISTSSVYGKDAVGDESLPLAPVSPYGVTKLAAENLALAHWRDSGFPATILRYFSVYGPGQRPDMAYRKFIAAALLGDAIDVYGSGEQTRSNTFIDDCVGATIAALDKGGAGEIYNIAGSEERSINEALAIMESHLGFPIALNRLPEARGDQSRTMGDTTKARAELGFTNAVTLEEGLARQIAWQRSESLD